MTDAATTSKATTKRAQQKRKPRRRKPKTFESGTPIFMQVLVDVAPGWYPKGEVVDPPADALIDHLVTLGGNE